MPVAAFYNAKLNLPPDYIDAIDYLAEKNNRSRARELRHRIMTDEEVTDAVQRIHATREEMDFTDDIET